MFLLAVLTLLVASATSADPESNCADGDQKSYRGTISQTAGGLTCQAWSSQTPHGHSRTPEKYPSSGLEENYCRNPDGEPKGVWCYTTSSKRWDYCDVPSCLSVEADREIYEMPEMRGVQISMVADGEELFLTTKEMAGSFWCGSGCEYVFTHEKTEETVWDIIPYENSGLKCSRIVKTGSYSAGQSIKVSSKNWDGEPSTMTSNVGEGLADCMEFIQVGDGNTFKIRSRYGNSRDMMVRAPPIPFTDPYVEKTRRFVRFSSVDEDNVWTVKA